MGGDSWHHNAALRPSQGVPLPEEVSVEGLWPYPCPAELLMAVHPCCGHGTEAADQTPFVKVGEKSPAVDLQAARDTLKKIEAFDADENILLLSAHDWSMRDVVEYYPERANGWKEKGWKEKGRWRFLADFRRAVKTAAGGKL